MNALQAMEKFVQERLQLFMDKMRQFSRTGEQINLGKWCHFFAFDVIGELVRGRLPDILLCTETLLTLACAGFQRRLRYARVRH